VLVELGADINAASVDGRTPVFIYAEESHDSMIHCWWSSAQMSALRR